MGPIRASLLFTALLVLVVLGAASSTAAAEAPMEEVAIPRITAERLGVSVGDIVEISRDPGMRFARRARIAVIYDGPEHPADVARGELEIRFHLPALESLLDRRDSIDRVVVRLRDSRETTHVRDVLRSLGSGYDVYTSDELVAHTSRTFVVVSRFHRAIALIALTASTIFLVTIMSLKLAEMRREIGALRLLGVARGTIGLTVMAIAAAVATAGSVAGLAGGAGLVWAINAYYQPLFNTRLRFAVLTPQTLAAACALAIAVGLVAGAVVAVRLLRRHPLEQVGR